ncbi:MAG: Xre family transcriptional regulator [Bacilli bacterium]|nr:Xre family transcriptional regulator [Bacilli bacterium]
MSELGQLLKKARLEKGITLDDMQETTKIRKRYLEAIEDGNYKILPGNFYVRAFIKSYSECVGLDHNEVLRLYRNVIPASQVESNVEPAPRKRNGIKTTDRWSRRVTTIVLISFFVLIFGLMYYFIEKNKNSGNNNQNTEEQGNRLTSKVSENQISNASASPNLNQAAATPQPTLLIVPPIVKLTSSANGVDYYNISSSQKIDLQISVPITDECWFQIDQTDIATVAKKMVEQGTLNKNMPNRSWTFDHSVSLRLGKASAAQVKVNGIVIPVGDLPNVKNFQFDLV